MKKRALAVSAEQFIDTLVSVATEERIYSPLSFIEEPSDYEILAINKNDIANFYRGPEEIHYVSKIWAALTNNPDAEYFNKAWMIARTKQCAEKF